MFGWEWTRLVVHLSVCIWLKWTWLYAFWQEGLWQWLHPSFLYRVCRMDVISKKSPSTAASNDNHLVEQAFFTLWTTAFLAFWGSFTEQLAISNCTLTKIAVLLGESSKNFHNFLRYSDTFLMYAVWSHDLTHANANRWQMQWTEI